MFKYVQEIFVTSLFSCWAQTYMKLGVVCVCVRVCVYYISSYTWRKNFAKMTYEIKFQ